MTRARPQHSTRRARAALIGLTLIALALAAAERIAQ
jgi:hypothetical protein